MIDTPPQPKRRRWRWLVMAVLLSATFTGWRFWPRGDARFAGTWSMVDANGVQVAILSLQRVGLSSVKQTPPGVPASKRQYVLSWNVEDGVLSFGNSAADFDTMYGRLMRKVAEVPGATFFPRVDRFKVEDVEKHQIRLRGVDQRPGEEGAPFSLKRVAE